MIKDLGLYTDIAVARVAEVEEECCPACGRLPGAEAPMPARRSERHLWRSWVLLAVAAYLSVVFGPPAWGDYQAVVNGREWLRGTEGLNESVVIDPFHYVIRNVKGSATAWETYVLASERMDRDVGALAVGVIAALLGLSAALRETRAPSTGRSLLDEGQPVPMMCNWLTTAAVAGWTLGEAIGQSIFGVLMVVFGYLALSALADGEQSFGLLLNHTVNRTLDVLADVVRLIQ
jgi:hypothetical protein